jgi:hypothetical protein
VTLAHLVNHTGLGMHYVNGTHAHHLSSQQQCPGSAQHSLGGTRLAWLELLLLSASRAEQPP